MASLRWIVVAACLLMAASAEEEPHKDAKKTHTENKLACGKILRSTPENMERYLRSEYPEDHETACFMRCVAIMSGSYDDESGVDLNSLYDTFGKDFLTLEQYQEESKACLEKRDEVTCYCMKAYKPIMCLREQYKKRKEAAA